MKVERRKTLDRPTTRGGAECTSGKKEGGKWGDWKGTHTQVATSTTTRRRRHFLFVRCGTVCRQPPPPSPPFCPPIPLLSVRSFVFPPLFFAACCSGMEEARKEASPPVACSVTPLSENCK